MLLIKNFNQYWIVLKIEISLTWAKNSRINSNLKPIFIKFSATVYFCIDEKLKRLTLL